MDSNKDNDSQILWDQNSLDVISVKTKMQDYFLDTIVSTKTGTKINYYPFVIFFDHEYCFYLKCRSENKSHTVKQILPGEILIDKIQSESETEPSFLQSRNFVDLTTLYQIDVERFRKICHLRNIEYAQLYAKYIQQKDRMNIVSGLLDNLQGKNPNIALIFCDVNMLGRTAFRIDYCSEKYLQTELELFDANLSPYEFINETDQREEYERIKDIKKIVVKNNQRYLKCIKENSHENRYLKLTKLFKKVKTKYIKYHLNTTKK